MQDTSYDERQTFAAVDSYRVTSRHRIRAGTPPIGYGKRICDAQSQRPIDSIRASDDISSRHSRDPYPRSRQAHRIGRSGIAVGASLYVYLSRRVWQWEATTRRAARARPPTAPSTRAARRWATLRSRRCTTRRSRRTPTPLRSTTSTHVSTDCVDRGDTNAPYERFSWFYVRHRRNTCREAC